MAGWAAWLVPLAVYAASLPNAPAYWDTGEMQTVPWIFGIAHPTGFPVFVIAAGMFAHVFAFGTVAWRINLFSALSMTGASWLIFHIILVLSRDGFPLHAAKVSVPSEAVPIQHNVHDVVIAMSGAWIFAFGEIAWTRGTRAEVHALATFFAMLTLYFAVRWYQKSERSAFVMAAASWGLGIATHPLVAMLLPALLILFIAHIRTATIRSFALAAAACIAGLSFYAYLPIRSAVVTQARLDPTLRLGDPPGRAFWDMDHPASWSGFVRYVSGSDYGAGSALKAMIRPRTYAAKVPQYFDDLLTELTPLGVLLMLLGAVVLWRRDSDVASALIFAALIPTSFSFGYSVEADVERYFLISFAVGTVLLGYGAIAAGRAFRPLRIAMVVLTLGIAAFLAVVNRGSLERRNSPEALSVIAGVQEKTPANAVLLAPWLDATPLAYAAYVQRSLGDRIVDSTWLKGEVQRVPHWIAQHRAVYVVGAVFGSVPGYRLDQISTSPDIYRVVKQ